MARCLREEPRPTPPLVTWATKMAARMRERAMCPLIKNTSTKARFQNYGWCKSTSPKITFHQLASAWGWMEMGQRRRASDGHWQKTLVIHFQPSTDLESRFWTYKFTSHFHFLLSHYPLSLSYIHSPLHNNSARMQVVIRHQDSLTPHLRQPWGHPGHYFLWGNIRFQRILDGE